MSGLRKTEAIKIYACTTKDQENLNTHGLTAQLNKTHTDSSSVVGQTTEKKGQPVVKQANKTKQSKKKLAINSSANTGLESSHNHANKHFTFGTPVSKMHLGNFFLCKDVCELGSRYCNFPFPTEEKR